MGKNKRYRLLPVSLYDRKALQAYFEDMAVRGYFIKKIGTFACFEKQNPTRVHYRLLPYLEEKERKEITGWQFVCSIEELFLVYIVDATEEWEIDLDRVADKTVFQTRFKKKIFGLLTSGLLELLTLGCFYFEIIRIPYPLIGILQYGYLVYIILVLLLFLHTMVSLIYECIHIWRVYKNKIEHPRITHRGQVIWKSIVILLLGMGICFGVYQEQYERSIPMSKYKSSLPTISLDQIESMYQKNSKDYVSYSWTPFGSKKYETYQERWNSETNDTLILETEYYEIYFSFFVDEFYDELRMDEVERMDLLYGPITQIELKSTFFEKAVLLDSSENQVLIAMSGNRIIYTKYSGKKQLEDYVEKIYQRMVAF